DFKTALESNPEKNEYKWFTGGRLNASENCLDRHLKNGKRNKAALIWQGEPEEEVRVFTYHMLHRKVCPIYLPMVPELVISMLACARIGASLPRMECSAGAKQFP
ncbi:hypothetical protein ADUPG1_004938, partial [Aduncisulcus paluster]